MDYEKDTKCQKCGHIWHKRTHSPLQCPLCRNRYYWKPRVRGNLEPILDKVVNEKNEPNNIMPMQEPTIEHKTDEKESPTKIYKKRVVY